MLITWEEIAKFKWGSLNLRFLIFIRERNLNHQLKYFKCNFMNRPQISFKYKMNLNKNMRFSCLNETSFSEQPLALFALNVPTVFHISLFLLNCETTPTVTYCIYINSLHFFVGILHCVQKRNSAATEPKECTWLLMVNAHVF